MTSNSHDMSLIPYQPEQSGQIVLRHQSTAVVYDERSRQLSLRDVSKTQNPDQSLCPTCHRPLRDDSTHSRTRKPTKPENADNPNADFQNPGYFRMLQHSLPALPHSVRPSTSVSDLSQAGEEYSRTVVDPPQDSEFLSSDPSPETKRGISTSAFSPQYFERFFVEEGELGRGGKGVVLLVRHVLDRVSLGHFACKRVPVGDDHTWLEKVLIEVQLLQHLSHQNLVSYRHVWLQDYKVTKFGPSVPCAFILQQYCNGGDLQRYVLQPELEQTNANQLKKRMRARSKGKLDPPVDLQPRRQMSFEEVFSFFHDITAGIHHLHTHGYIHRDLKPQNCLLHREGGRTRVLVSDFGEMQTENTIRKSSGATGTVAYCAPEVLRRTALDGGFGNFTTKSDVFSLGMIVYFMCFGKLPYSLADQINEETEDLDELRDEIAAWAGISDQWRENSDLPDRLCVALKRLLALDPGDRPSTEEILQAMLENGATSPSPPEIQHDRLSPPFFVERRISSIDSPAATPARGPSPRGRLGSSGRIGNQQDVSFKKQTPSSDERQLSPVKRRAFVPSRQQNLNSEENQLALTRSRQTSPEQQRQESHDSRPTSPTKRLALPAPPSTSQSFLNPLNRMTSRSIGFLRLIAFILKFYSLLEVCSPYGPRPIITCCLLMIAALDLVTIFNPADSITGLDDSHDTQKSIFLFSLHFATVFLVNRFFGRRAVCLSSNPVFES